MANKLRGEVPFQVEGQDYTLSFGINSLCALEDKLGKTVTEIGALFGSNMGIRELRAVFWAGLQDHHEGTSEQQAGKLMTALGAARAGEVIGEAFVAAFPEAAGGKAGPRKGRGAGTGSGSSKAGAS